MATHLQTAALALLFAATAPRTTEAKPQGSIPRIDACLQSALQAAQPEAHVTYFRKNDVDEGGDRHRHSYFQTTEKTPEKREKEINMESLIVNGVPHTIDIVMNEDNPKTRNTLETDFVQFFMIFDARTFKTQKSEHVSPGKSPKYIKKGDVTVGVGGSTNYTPTQRTRALEKTAQRIKDGYVSCMRLNK